MTTAVKDMLAAYPGDLESVDREKLSRCIEECLACAQACTACADACMSEREVGELTKCIRTDMDCADICGTTAAVLSRHTGYDADITRVLLQACATVCKACGDECGQHAGRHEHCRVCAEVCRRCEQACNDLIASLG
ncbi:four-helix bundle copper-binding protein [Streptomyces sp. NPDC026294]|uniref:four-helix bundle copper-binding protein n=1 Tax=Streptomyces sp. NPDC026294 TaxID=3155362 RepID=UPI0034070194